jgi:HJR/Mrr/RecB family endonuclease
MKKPRSDSKLKSLPPQQRETLVRWLAEENIAYDEARERLRREFGVKTSTGALVNFYATCCWKRSSEHAREFSEQVTEAAKSGGEDFDTATLALIQERAFVLARTQGSDVGDLATLAKIISDSVKLRIKQRELDLGARRVALLEKKAAQADEAQAATEDNTLTDEERTKRLRQIFRM